MLGRKTGRNPLEHPHLLRCLSQSPLRNWATPDELEVTASMAATCKGVKREEIRWNILISYAACRKAP